MQSEINDKNRAAKMAAADSEVLAIRAEQSEEENRRQRATIEELTVEAEERTRILHEVEGRAEELEERYGALQRKYMEQRNMNSQLILDVQALKGNIQVRPHLTFRVNAPLGSCVTHSLTYSHNSFNSVTYQRWYILTPLIHSLTQINPLTRLLTRSLIHSPIHSQVCCRVRPMSEGEASAGQQEPAVVSITETEVAVLRRDPNKGEWSGSILLRLTTTPYCDDSLLLLASPAFVPTHLNTRSSKLLLSSTVSKCLQLV